jgi:hypothetical protein
LISSAEDQIDMARLPHDKIPDQDNSTLPDLAYIRKLVPIEECAEVLGFDVSNHTMRCFRPENHQHGDRTPSFQFYKNNRAQCFCCDAHAYSNVDFIKLVLGYDTWTAVRWISARFDVPKAHVGRPRGSRSREKHVQVGVYGGPLESIIRSGLYARMSFPARVLLPVLVAVQNDGEIDFSYQALLRVTGIGSTASVKSALDELADVHAISILKRRRVGEQNARNVYKLTLNNPDLLARIDDTARVHWAEVEQERQARAESRRLRSHARKTVPSSPF